MLAVLFWSYLRLLSANVYGCPRCRRSYVVVVYSPTSAECRAAEAEIERLAAGVKHDRSVAVIGLNADSPSNKAIVQQLLQVRRRLFWQKATCRATLVEDCSPADAIM